MIMVVLGLTGGRHKKAAGGVATCGDLGVQSLSQPQARAFGPKIKVKASPKVSGLAAHKATHWLTARIHTGKIANRLDASSAPIGCRSRLASAPPVPSVGD